MSERVPVEVFAHVIPPLLLPEGLDAFGEGLPFRFDHAVMAPIVPFEIREEEIVGLGVGGQGPPAAQRADHALAKAECFGGRRMSSVR